MSDLKEKSTHEKDFYFYVGVSYCAEDNINDAAFYYEKAITLDKTFEPILNLKTEFTMEELEKMEETTNKYLKDLPQLTITSTQNVSKETYNKQGKYFMSKSQHQEAINSYLKAIELDPLYKVAHYNLGEVYDDQKKYESAKNCYLKVISIDENYKDAHYNLGHIYYNEEKFEDACKSFEAAINIDKNYKEAYFILGTTYDELEKWDMASKSYKKAIELDPENKDAYYNLGISLDKKGLSE